MRNFLTLAILTLALTGHAVADETDPYGDGAANRRGQEMIEDFNRRTDEEIDAMRDEVPFDNSAELAAQAKVLTAIQGCANGIQSDCMKLLFGQ